MKKQTANKLRPFGMRDKLGYLFGDFGNDFTFLLSSTFLMKFCTDVMGISAAVVGTLMMVARIIDAFTDVTMGRIVDSAKPTKAGKFKPWLIRMCVPAAISSFLIYMPGLGGEAVQSWSVGARIVYISITYVLWGSFCYTGINIPYGSMASAVSAEAADRQSLSTFRTMGGMLAGMLINVLVPIIAYETVVDPETGASADKMVAVKFAITAGVCSVLAVVCYLLCYKLITERIPYEASGKKEKQPSVGAMLKNALNNRALISIIAASILMLLAQLTMQGMNSYVYPDYYGNALGQSISSIVMMVGMIVAAVVTKPLSKKFGKAEVSAFSCILATAVCLVTWIMKPANMWVFIGMQGLNWVGLGMFSMVNWALITDVIDYSEVRNGVREDGSVYALYSFARKLGQALASGVSGWLLTAIGYNENAAVQTESVKDGIFAITNLVPAIGFCLLAVVLIFWYPLHKKQVEENNAILKSKREA